MIKLTKQYRLCKYATFLLDILLAVLFIIFQRQQLGGKVFLWFESLLVIAVLMISLYAFRAFNFAQHRTRQSLISSILMGWITGTIISTFLIVIFSIRPAKPYFIFLSLWIFISVLCIHLIAAVIIPHLIGKENIFVIGSRDKFQNIIGQLSKATSDKINVAAYLDPEENNIRQKLEGNPSVHTVFIADRGSLNNLQVSKLLSGLINKDLTIRYLPDVVEKTIQKIPLNLAKDYRRFYDISFITTEPGTYQRSFDVLISATSLVLLFPLYLLIALALAFSSGFPVIFRQERVGLFEKPFTLYKFRTMKLAPPDEGPAFLTANGEERITKIGNFLRKTRLDEIPQLLNVLKGDMSIIGPRPEMKEFYEEGKKNIPFYRYRTRLRPGITGWAQVNFRHTTDLEDYKKKTEYDLYYIKNRSILLDLQIVLLTAEVMLGLKGSR